MLRTRVTTAVLLVFSAAFAAAQSAGPWAAYVFPAGGRRGTTFTVTVAGQGLRTPLGAEVSGGGVSVRVLGYTGKAGPLTKVQEEELRRRLQALAGIRGATDAGPAVPEPAGKVDLPDLPELRNLESKTRPQLKLVADQFLNRDKRPKPPMDELVTLEITLAAGAAATRLPGLGRPALAGRRHARSLERDDRRRRLFSAAPAA